MRPNVLLITLDQFRGDCLSAAGHPVVRTPQLDRLAESGTRFARHYSQAAPCAPGRASLYTGMYQMNHRVLGNGSPLDRSHDNVALMARRAGYAPVLFGYTDQAIDPRDSTGPDDPRLSSYEGVLPGFDCVLDLTASHEPWVTHLASLGHDVSQGVGYLLAREHKRPAEHSVSAFLTDAFLSWLNDRESGWFAHLSYLRPHPPYSAAGEYGSMYAPDDLPFPIAPVDGRHPLHELMLGIADTAAPTDESNLRWMRAQYLGMISEVDAQLGRVWDALVSRGEWNDTVIVVTADHGEMLGDHGLRDKGGFFEQSQHIVGITRVPGGVEGRVVDAFTENVDIMPTFSELFGLETPLQCDGRSLVPFLRGGVPAKWRDAAHWEFDWSPLVIPLGEFPWPDDRRLSTYALSVRRDDTHAYVQFADGTWLCFDLVADPTWRTPETRVEIVLEKAQATLQWRMNHARRDLSHMVLSDGGVGRWPSGVSWRD